MPSAQLPLARFTRRGVLSVCVFFLSIYASAQQGPAVSAKCWSTTSITFPAGSLNDVLEAATDFLINAEKLPTYPYWPGGRSGITIGVGWDLGQPSEADFRRVWHSLDEDSITRLSVAARKTGHSAQALKQELRTVVIPEKTSRAVLQESLREREYPQTLRLLSGTDRLPTEFQVALISVIFNRGAALGHDPDWRQAKALDNRWEMRKLQGDVSRGDLFAIYIRLGTMKRLWENDTKQRGLPIRRRDEQHLLRPYVDKVLNWEQRREEMKAAGLPACSTGL